MFKRCWSVCWVSNSVGGTIMSLVRIYNHAISEACSRISLDKDATVDRKAAAKKLSLKAKHNREDSINLTDHDFILISAYLR